MYKFLRSGLVVIALGIYGRLKFLRVRFSARWGSGRK